MRLRIKLSFVVDLGEQVVDLPIEGDLNDAFEGAMRGLYLRLPPHVYIEPGGRAAFTRLNRRQRKPSNKT